MIDLQVNNSVQTLESGKTTFLKLSEPTIYWRFERSSTVTGDSSICAGAHQNATTIPIKAETANSKPRSNNLALHCFSRKALRRISESRLIMNRPTPNTSAPKAQINWKRVSRWFCRSICQNAARTGMPNKRANHGPTKTTQSNAAGHRTKFTSRSIIST